MAPYHSPMHGIAAALLASVLLGNSPASTNNDDSCDIGVAPAATLLLPYFEISVNQPRELAASTLVTVVNAAAVADGVCARYYDNATVATTWQMWREGGVTGRAACRDYAQNSKLKVAEMIRFDEHDNATTVNCWYFYWPCQFNLETSAVSAKPASDPFFPQTSSSGDVGGWMYLNLDEFHNGGAYRPTQAWVLVRMTDSRRAILYDAAHLGNGCSPPVATGATVAPAGGVPVCPTGSVSCTFDPRYFATNVTP